uniref:Big-1 domain-containing protein n=1 Tax=uncultured marine thaumarchaeote KM3_72_A09 TaxID=1456261 RepID=A0A075HPY5_9ARCH|nr:hypothetical protein [uncultured marine thaumarchaeote KM3_72_A09]
MLIDETKGSGQGPVILQGTSPYTVGDTFTDPLTQTEVRVDSQGQSGFTVHFSRDLILEQGAAITSISATFGTSSIDVVQTNNTKVSAGIDRAIWFNVTARNNNIGFFGADLYTTIQSEGGETVPSSEFYVPNGATSTGTRWYVSEDNPILLGPSLTRFAIRLWWDDYGVHKLQDEKQFELHTVSLKTLNFTSTVPKVSKGGDSTKAFVLFKNGGNDVMFNSRISIVDTKGLIFSSTIESVNEIPPDSFASTSFDISASPQLASGDYRPTVQIRYQDFAGVEKIETFELRVNVTKMLTAVDLSAPEDLELGQNVILRAKVIDENGQPVSGQNVVFKLDSIVLGSAVTNGLGEATLSYVVEAKAGSYTLSAQFAGSDIHEQSSTSIQLRIKPLTLVIKTDFPNIEIATIAGTAHVSNSEGDVRVEIDSLDRISVEVKPAVEISGGSRGTFFQWSDGVKDNPRIIDLVGDLVLTTEYKTQHLILAESPYGEVSGSGWYDHGTTATIRLTATLIEHDNQTRRVFSQWSGDLVTSDIVFQTVMNSPKTIQAHWATQYFLSVSSDIGAPEESGWYDRGLVRNATSGYAFNKGASNRWSLSAYELDGHFSDVERNSTGEAVVPLSMDKPHTLIFRFTEQFELEIHGGRDVSFSPLSPTGDMWFDKGSSVTVQTSNSWPLQEGSRTRLTGWQIDGGETFAVKAEGSAPVETATVRMDAPHLLALLGVIQHSLDVNGADEIEFNPPSPSSDIWFDEGMNVSVTTQRVWNVTSTSRLNFAEWLLDEVVKAVTRETSGSFSTPSIEMDRSHTVVFVPIMQHRILVHGTSFGLQWGDNVEIKGSITDDDWFDVGRPIQVSVDSTWDLNPEDSRKRLISWQVDDGKVVELPPQDGRFSTSDIVVKAAHDIYFNGANQYFLKVISPYGEVEGQGWYDEGTNAEATAQTTIDLGNGTRRVFKGWQGTLDNPSNIVMLEMKSPASLLAGWKTQFLVTVTSPYGKVDGAGWYDESSTATITMLGRTIDHGNATRRVFVAWHGDIEAMDTPYSFSIRDPKVIQTSWRSDYLTSLVFTGRHGREVIPASITITMANGSATELSHYSNLWITKGDISMESITWAGTNVVQTDQGRLSVIEPSIVSVPVAVRDIEIQVSDPLGLPLMDAPVSVTLPNSTKVTTKTSSDGAVTLRSVAEGEYTTSVVGLAQTVEAGERDDLQQVTVVGTAPILGVMALVSIMLLAPALIILRKRRHKE